jgi:hypothetical protein
MHPLLIVLTVLGGTMLALHYWDVLAGFASLLG